jgi:hypothetical protein
VTREERRRAKAEAKRKLREEGKDQDPLTMKARAVFMFEALQHGTEEHMRDFESRHPGLFGEAMVSLARSTFESLRARLEDPEEKAVTWREPFLEVRFPVAFDPDSGPLPLAAVEAPPFSPEDFTDENWRRFRKALKGGEGMKDPLVEGALERFAEFGSQAFELGFFLTVTHGTVLFKEGEEYTAAALKDWAQDPPEGASPEETQAAFEKLCQPFVLSGPPPGEGIRLSGTVDEKPFTGSVVFEVHPLVVDVNEEEAFFPVIGGLVLEGEGGDPAAWSEEDRVVLWDALSEELDRLAESLRSGDETGTTSETGTIGAIKGHTAGHSTATARLEAFPEAAVYTTPPPERKTFPLAFGSAIGDRGALALLDNLHAVRLPAKGWASLKSWPDLVEAEVQRIREEEGEAAFDDLGRKTGDAKARGPLLKRRFRAGGQEVVELTAEAEKRLKVREGFGRGFRHLDRDTGAEYFVRLFQLGGGYLEVGLSWYGLAGPWVEDWRRDRGQEVKAEADRVRQGLLFDELGERERERVELAVRRFQSLEDGKRIMEAVLGQVHRQCRNPVRIPALAFRELLDLQNDKDWRSRVKGGLESLRACSFKVGSFDTEKVEGYGSFLSAWWYQGAGGGAHGEGDYFLNVETSFLGCLYIFESGRRKLSSKGEVVLYDFGKKPTAEEKKALGWGSDRKKDGGTWTYQKREAVATFARFDAGRVFYNAKAGLTDPQKRLVAFLEREVTLRKDTVSKKLGDHKVRKASQAKSKDAEANEPRLYGRDFCPLLPEGKLYHGALGHFSRHPETGRSLYGTGTRSTATGGPHTNGLLSVLGYYLPPGSAGEERKRLVFQALGDLQAVVVDYLEGAVAARGPEGRWLTPEEASKLPERDLGRKTKWFLFLPETWRADRTRKWEAASGWDATEDPAEAERARAALAEAPTKAPSGETGLVLLRHRLRAARLDRGLRLEDVGSLFGVSKMTVSKWETGVEPDEDERSRGKPIPGELAPLVTRWVETGEPPRPEELAARRTRRQGVNPETGKPWKARDEAEP